VALLIEMPVAYLVSLEEKKHATVDVMLALASLSVVVQCWLMYLTALSKS
jgi:hypothetical protein